MDKPKLIINFNTSSSTGEAIISCTAKFQMVMSIYDAIKYKELAAGYIANEMRKFMSSVTEDDIATDPVFKNLEEIYKEKKDRQWLE